MAKFRSHKNSFIAGEISPTAMGRSDIPQYLHACKLLRNAIPLPSGGVYARPGSLFEDEVDATTDFAPALIPFVVSKTEAYSLLIGKVVGGNGVISGFVPGSNTSASAGVTVTGTHPYKAAMANTVSTVGYYDEWHDVQYTQSADVLTLVHPRYKPMRLYRTSFANFQLAYFDQDSTGTTFTGTKFRDAWPYRPQNTSAITLEINTATVGAGRTLTASAALFNASHVGAVFKVNNGGTIGCARVTGYTDSTHVTVDVVVAFGAAATPVTTWWESAWSDYRGWPRSVCYFQKRIAYGGGPDTLWFSETGDYDQMSHDTIQNPETAGNGTTGADDTQAFTYTLNSQQLNQVQWMSSDRKLIVGTLGDEWVIDMISSELGFDCGNVSAVAQSHFGSSYHQVSRAGKELFFSLQADDEVRSLVFSETEEAYIDESVQVLFDHYPKVEVNAGTGDRKYRKFAWDGSRKVLWCCDTAGNLFGMTRDRKSQVTAWHSHQMGGYDSSITGGTVTTGGSTTVDPAYYACAGSVISLAVIPNPLLGVEDLWLVVKRKRDGAWVYHVERIIGKQFAYESVYNLISNGSGNYFVDSAVFGTNEYPGAEDYIFDGLDHLEGEAPIGTASNSNGLFRITGSTISSGETTLQPTYPPNFESAICTVVFGLGFNVIAIPVRPDVGSQIGSGLGAIKRIHEAHVRFYNTMAAKVGRDADNLETLNFRSTTTPMNKSAELYTGDKRVKVDSDYDRDAYLYILSDQPLPFCLVSLISEGMTYD